MNINIAAYTVTEKGVANREDPDQTASEEAVLRSSLIWVCSVCLCLFGRQLVYEILLHLLYVIL